MCCKKSYVDSSDSIKTNKATINAINKKDNKSFQYAATIPLNHDELGKHSEIITKIEPFINKYKWEGVKFPSEKGNWKKFEKSNLTVAVDVLFAKKENISC